MTDDKTEALGTSEELVYQHVIQLRWELAKANTENAELRVKLAWQEGQQAGREEHEDRETRERDERKVALDAILKSASRVLEAIAMSKSGPAQAPVTSSCTAGFSGGSTCSSSTADVPAAAKGPRPANTPPIEGDGFTIVDTSFDFLVDSMEPFLKTLNAADLDRLVQAAVARWHKINPAEAQDAGTETDK